MSIYNQKKTDQLGMPIGTATNKLRKKIIFHFIKLLELDNCYRCKKKIESEEVLSIEHKESWLDSNNPVEEFFDINNIAFSHLICNVRAGSIGGHSHNYYKTKCSNGHDFSPENTYFDIRAKRRKCKTCRRNIIYKSRKKAF